MEHVLFLDMSLSPGELFRLFQRYIHFTSLPQRLSSSGCCVVFRSSVDPFCFDSFSDVVSCYWSSEGIFNASSFSPLQLTNE